MTIAIGIVAMDGLVVAADRQETVGYQKNSQGKVTWAWKADPRSSLIVSGAGDGACLDSIGAKLKDWFLDEKEEDIKKIASFIETMNQDFYSTKVLPVTGNPDEYGPDYSLLMAGSVRGVKRLWTTDKLVLNTAPVFDAVGIGAATAKALLGKLFAFTPVINAINLAAFVLHEVKKSVNLCGLETDIAYIWNDAPQFIDSKDIREMEDAFDILSAVERGEFHYCIGSDASSDPRLSHADVKQRRTQVREIFTKLNDKRSAEQQRILKMIADSDISTSKRPRSA